MPYSAEVSRKNPTCFLFMIDQSGSMSDPCPGFENRSKAEYVADVVNRIFQNLILRCAKAEGVRDYFHIGVLGYGAQVGRALGGELANYPNDLIPISKIAEHPIRVEERMKRSPDGAGGYYEEPFKFPIFLEPVANGSTPMTEAMRQAYYLVDRFCSEHPDSFPPVVLNLTDGEPTDGNPEQDAQSIRELHTNDGQVLLFNLHISSSNAKPIQYPVTDAGLPDDAARMLYRMSSVMPPMFVAAAQERKLPAQEGSRGYVFNADAVAIAQFLDIGTRVDRQMR
ncbi:MAG: hypothetical protein KatS3mg107_1236 [Gemmataceae bacterium]|jgi:hypothetical protein|nr:MAG: hypothetical protein KatS3mg107_1236 [Gemmataceae bacterium]